MLLEGDAGLGSRLNANTEIGGFMAVARARGWATTPVISAQAEPGGKVAGEAYQHIAALLITLTPGYFWYLSLTPQGPGQVRVLYGGGMSADYIADPAAPAHLAQVKALLDAVNIEDKGCTEKVYRGLLSTLSAPGPLSHLERPNYEFAAYLAGKIPA